MPFFKYTVANQQGKQLSGTVEAVSMETARTELNNLGFSIINIEETSQAQSDNLPRFAFEAIDAKSRTISGTIPATTTEEALKKLKDEYHLTVTAVWKEGSSPEEIQAAREKGIADITATKAEPLTQQVDHEEEFVRNKIDYVLKKIYELIQRFGDRMEADEKAEIQKKIDKLLRIKSSTNLDYVVTTAREILFAIQKQEKVLGAKGFENERILLALKTKELLSELKKTAASKTLSDDILEKIETWQGAHEETQVNSLLDKIKAFFKKPIEVIAIENQIKSYNKQLIEFAKLYFKEPSKEYKQKIKSALKTIWAARRKAKHSLKALRSLRNKKGPVEEDTGLVTRILEELNALTGWLLFFYIIYYFTSLYLTSKDFGLTSIPKGFLIYDSHLFKYALVIIFLLHICIALKVNFFRKSFLANLVLLPAFFFGSIIVLINF